MRSRTGRLSMTVAVMSGLLALSAAPAFAQQKGGGASKPAAGASAPKGGAAAPAKGSGAPAPAADKPLTDAQKRDKVKKLFKDAEAKFKKDDCAGALPLYQEADTLVPGPAPKYKIGKCQDKAQKYVEAAAAYQAFVDLNPDEKKFGKDVEDAKARLGEIKKMPSQVKVTVDPPGPPNFKLNVDNQPATSLDLKLAPGKHTLAATADGFDPAQQDVDVPFASSIEAKIALKATPPPPPPPPPPVAVEPPPPPPKPAPPPPPPPKSNVPAYVTLGLAGAGAVVGTIFGISALSAKSTFKDNPTTDNADKADRNALISDMSYAVALTFGVTGLVLLLSNDTPAEQKAAHSKHEPIKTAKPRPIVVPYVGPTGGGAAATMKF